MERRFQQVVQRFGVSQEDIEQIDNLVLSQISSGGNAAKGNFKSGQDSLNFYGSQSAALQSVV